MCKSLLAYICPPGLTFILLALLSAGVVGRASAQIAFTDVSIAAGLGSSASETWGAAWGDVNGDLCPDVFFKGIDARIYVTSGGVTQYREHNGGYHRWSQNFLRGHVGLAGNTRADITVDWPDGTATLYPGLPANRVYRLRQDGSFVALSS